ncbi:unnamed protein product [Chilo suppressalis]|uniref:Uncharacterized protein n=1 Tax=Chilo suppressalis TaxID=168631 RepID=A0ABN8AY11_CHISP|nr:unnamed protein product [Chilo suppressalis]
MNEFEFENSTTNDDQSSMIRLVFSLTSNNWWLIRRSEENDDACFVYKDDSTRLTHTCRVRGGLIRRIAFRSFRTEVLPEATEQACAKCTPAQKHMLKRYLEEVKKTFPADMDVLKQKYDPEGKHIEALRAALANA